MGNVLILGAGVMGSAMTAPLCDNGHNVQLVGTHLDEAIIKEVQKSRIHPKLKMAIPQEVQAQTIDCLKKAIQKVDLILLGVNSLGIDWAIQTLGPLLPGQIPILAVTKGLAGEDGGLKLLPDILQTGLLENYGLDIQVCCIAGPAIAGEVAAKRQTCVVFTSKNDLLSKKLAKMLRTPSYHIWTSPDFVGVELCAALKNAYALAVGLVQGILEKSEEAMNSAAMHNMAAAIFAQGLWEIGYLIDEMGGRRTSIFQLPGAGDLYVTCQGGRNSRMGRLLGLGMRYSQAKAQYMAGETIEGAELALAIGPAIEEAIESATLDHKALPLLQSIINIICHDAPANLLWDVFFKNSEV